MSLIIDGTSGVTWEVPIQIEQPKLTVEQLQTQLTEIQTQLAILTATQN